MTSPDECSRIGELLPEFLAGRVSEADDRSVRAHLEVCADCRNRADAVSLLQETPIPMPDPGRWDHFVEGVVDATEGNARTGRRRRGWMIAAVLAAAAIVVFSWVRLVGVEDAGSLDIDALAREVAELPEGEAAAWTAGLSPAGFMPAGFDTSGLSTEELEQLVREVGRT
jgi:predicted anti-sigma-YlaC factor YlaD